MSFELKYRTIDGVQVMDLSGRLVAGEPQTALKNAVAQALEAGQTALVLNLGNVSFIDSSGLGELVVTYTRVRNKGGKVTMLNLTKTAKDLLQMTKLLTVFDTYDDEAKAIAGARA